MEKVILSHLILNDEYARKVFPFLNSDYFHDTSEKTVFEMIEKYVQTYSDFPNKESLYVELQEREDLSEPVFDGARDIIREMEIDEATKLDWLVDKTEEFCQDKALFNAISKSINIIDSGEKSLTKAAIPQLLQDALQVCFDTSVGHDLLNDVALRWEQYHEATNHISTGITLLDKISGGGFFEKALFCFMAPPGIGKSLVMCSLAAHMSKEGANVLYISMEMSEKMISMRIDSNWMDVDSTTIAKMERNEFLSRYETVKQNVKGQCIIKEFPSTGANANHFRNLLEELRIKKKFTPDIVFIDYLNICASTRYRAGSVNSYTYIKAIAEELRSIGAEFAIPVVTATQVNRNAAKSLDIDMDDTADSFGLPMTVDLLLAIAQDEELDSREMYLFKQVKNRNYPLASPRRFMVGVDKSRMRIYNIELEDQGSLLDGPSDTDMTTKQKPKVQGFS